MTNVGEIAKVQIIPDWTTKIERFLGNLDEDLQNFDITGARLSKVPKSFRTRKAIAKSQSL